MPRGRVCAWRGVRHVRGDTSPVTCSRGYTPAHICVTVVRQTRRAGERLNARRRRLSRSSQNRTPPCQRTPTQRIPPSNPCVILHHQGLFGVCMRSSALAYFRQHGASDYHQTATRVSTSRTFYQQIPTVVYGRSGATTRPLSHNGPHTYT